MAEKQGMTHPTRVRRWRWRRSPLRRPLDLVEAWVLLAAWTLALVGGVLAGVVSGIAADRSFAQQRVDRQQIAATVVEGPKDAESEQAISDERVWVTVRWTATDGTKYTNRTLAAGDTRAGDRVTVWTDGHGTLTAPPLGPTEAFLESSLLGVLATATVCGAVWVSAQGVRGCLERKRMARWDEEWERIDTQWGQTAG
ncbi:Rv1733c family protein [Streptomyces sp. NPDC002845]